MPVHQFQTSNVLDSKSESEEQGLNSKIPPPLQLTASPINPPSDAGDNGPGKHPFPENKLPGGEQNKGNVPSNDYPVGEGIFRDIKPTMVPEEIVNEIQNKIKGIGDLELCADVVIVHSPCYSAEIHAIMLQVNQGEIDLETAEQEILNRLAYLLTNEFKNAEGEVNTWAEGKKGDGTVANEANKGATWYRMGEAGGPQYMALTDWNDSTDPNQGANNYSVFRFAPDAEQQGEEKPEYFQPFGNPLTSVNATGYDKGPKATHTGTPIDVSILEILISLFGGSNGSKRAHNSEKAKDMRGPIKTGGENANAQHDKDILDKENKQERERKLEWEKEVNTWVSYKVKNPNFSNTLHSEQSYRTLIKNLENNPKLVYHAKAVHPKEEGKPFFSLEECNQKFRELHSKAGSDE